VQPSRFTSRPDTSKWSRSGVSALLNQLAELLHVGFARVSGNAGVGRLHLGTERCQVGSRHLHARRFELLDLLGLVISDELAHEIAGSGALLAEDRLLGGVSFFQVAALTVWIMLL
jgi:hypothetical protein